MLFFQKLNIISPTLDVSEDSISEGSEYEVIHPPDHIRMQSDLSKLRIALNESSWGEVVVYYMDMMERLYATDVSTESKSTVLRGVPIELEYDTVADGINEEGNTTDINLGATSYGVEESGLPDGFDGYLGPPGCTLSRAYTKLSAHDPWTLSAEELMALLRALVDDILAEKSDLANDIANRYVMLHLSFRVIEDFNIIFNLLNDFMHLITQTAPPPIKCNSKRNGSISVIKN